MSILDEIYKEEVWLDFLKEKKRNNQLNRQEEKEFESFIMNKDYMNVDLNSFSYPEKIVISKIETNKKRTVYTYTEQENHVLSLIAQLLKKYDGCLSERCYSFRSSYTPKKAFDNIRKIKNLKNKHVLKIDIHNYFNSIDVDILMDILNRTIKDDDRLLRFIEILLKQDKCIYKGKVIKEKRGAMAGVPIANFFANIYLTDLDNLFTQNGIEYFRYSDDIIMFFDDEKTIYEYYEILKHKIEEKKLTFNEEKLMIVKPEQSWEFLGFSYNNNEIDLSDGAIIKLKRKIKRKARKIYRWRMRKSRTFDDAARLMIKNFDNKFYDLNGKGGFCWIRFYFPILTTDKGLKKIDEYMLKYLRYLYSGRHYKGNYRIRYEQLKDLGYTPLCAEYYNWKKENRQIRESKKDNI